MTAVLEVEAGSSPRMRGTHAQRRAARRLGRFIPAHAGNTTDKLVAMIRALVHPRACGEHVMVRGSWVWSVGSSPRMRGTPIGDLLPREGRRFIPAHAGNTSDVALLETYTRGSSPRMRGTLPAQ